MRTYFNRNTLELATDVVAKRTMKILQLMKFAVLVVYLQDDTDADFVVPAVAVVQLDSGFFTLHFYSQLTLILTKNTGNFSGYMP